MFEQGPVPLGTLNHIFKLLLLITFAGCSPSIDGYVRQLEHPDVDVRVYGAEKLGERGNLDAVPHLIQALQDEKARVRLTAIDALSALGDARATGALFPFLRDKRAVLVLAAIDALGQIGDVSAVDSLVAFVQEGVPTFRLAAIDALGRLGDVSAVDALCLQTRDETPQVRWVSAMALGRIGSADAVAYLVELLCDEDERVREAALFSLAQIDENWRTRDEANRACQRFVRDLKQENVLGNGNALSRFLALQGLNTIVPDWRKKDWAESLVTHWCRWVVDGNDNEREVAARFLGDLEDDRVVDRLLAAMQDSDRGVRRQAVWSLGRIGNVRVAQVLKQALVGGDVYIRGPAAQALGTLGDTSAVVLLAGLVDEQMLAVHGGQVGGDLPFSIAVSLGVLNDLRGVDALILLLRHKSGYVRRASAQSLGQIGDLRALDALLAGLHDDSGAVRWRVARALGKFNDSRVVDALVGRLGKKAWDDRPIIKVFNCVNVNWRDRADARIKIDGFISKFENGKDMDRIAAATLLSEIGGDRICEVLLQALSQRELKVVAAAYPFFLRQYTLSAVPVLIQALDHEGDAHMAGAMLSSGHPKLAKAARRWAYTRGMALVHPTEDPNTM